MKKLKIKNYNNKNEKKLIKKINLILGNAFSPLSEQNLDCYPP